MGESGKIFLIIPTSFFCGILGALLVYKFGTIAGLINEPNERSSHVKSVPRGGGIGIWAAFVFTGIFVINDYISTFMISAIGLLGFLDDYFDLSSKKRLLFQLLISTVVVFLYKGVPDSLVNLFIALFWIIFVTGSANYYNFMDGINGMAGLTGFVGFGLLAAFSFLVNNDMVIFLLSISLSAACSGFLPLNFPNAKVFMGDAGSVFLGFVFASFVVKLSTSIGIFLCLIMFLCTFYADAIVTIYYRWRKGENLMRAHRSHLYQYLSNELRFPHWKVSTIYAFIQLIFGILALFAFGKGLIWQYAVLIIFSTLFLASHRIIKNIRPVE